MCGRFTLAVEDSDLQAEFEGIEFPATYARRYNIAPSQPVLAVRISPTRGKREFVWLRCGFIPRWSSDLSSGYKMINPRIESVAEMPAFREAFRYRRCLIPASGFYEWQKQGAGKQPYLVSLRGGRIMAIAGLWERWQAPDEVPIESCTILTMDANETVAPLHNRMPVIVAPGDYELWLSGADPAALRSLLTPIPADMMEIRPVSRRVNDPSVDEASLLESA